MNMMSLFLVSGEQKTIGAIVVQKKRKRAFAFQLENACRRVAQHVAGRRPRFQARNEWACACEASVSTHTFAS